MHIGYVAYSTYLVKSPALFVAVTGSVQGIKGLVILLGNLKKEI